LDDIDAPPEPQNLRFLRRLVSLLTIVMIVGMVVVIALLITRLQAPPSQLKLPETIELPEGVIPLAYTRGPDWYAITSADALFIYDLEGTLQQTVEITR
jgi:hypothetical protein